LKRAKIEGTIVSVCDACLSYGKEIKEAVKPVAVSRPAVRKRVSTSLPGVDEETVLVSDYGKKIIKARIKLDLKRENFAKKINEKESVIRRIELQEMVPDDKLIKKLEYALDIKLRETYKKPSIKGGKSDQELTIGDIIEVE